MKLSFAVWPGFESLGEQLNEQFQFESIKTNIRKFPDGETYVRVLSEVKGNSVLLVNSLRDPDSEIMPLIFLTKKVREMGAKHVVLLTPYLPYMRQDATFNPGEVITARYFAELISSHVDHLITVDCHLHRISSLGEIYNIPTQNISSAMLLADWIKRKVQKPLLVGPDSESKQWVQVVARHAKAPYVVFSKQRYADHSVTLKLPDLSDYKDYTPVLVDDIISTAGTMCEAVKHLKQEIKQLPVCMGIHAVFSPGSYDQLVKAGVSKIVTTNSIPHITNEIDLTPILISSIGKIRYTQSV